MGLLDKIFGDPNEKIVKTLQPIIDEINSHEDKLKSLKDEDIKEKTVNFKDKLLGAKADREKLLDKLLPEAFALVREASSRVLGMRHYDVQMIGGIILHRGQIAEMKTGEGKTLVATLSLYLNALNGKGVQLITVNDYLAMVGAGWMAPVYYLLGLTTSVIIHDSALIYDPEFKDESQYDVRLQHFRPITRKEAYECDILYGTNNEFGFDYLRDNMAPSFERKVQRDLNYCIVDEIDSILIDEARTPLIISAPAEESTDKYVKFAQLVGKLNEDSDYNVDEKMKAATLSEEGITKMEKWLGVDNIYTTSGVREVHHIEQALKAHTLFKRDRDYVVKDGEVIIVDEFTGRMMQGRRFSEGLHQAIEAKEGVTIQRESQTLATITFQNYFRLYNKLSGMTGTAATEAEEFSKIYNLETVIIPTHKENKRQDLNDLIFRSELGKYKAVIKEVKERNKKGQPVLIGTISIEKNELLSNMMEREGLHPQVLNAKNHEKEAKFIAKAGNKGSITIATNMAGRGVDIVLGGHQATKEVQEEIRKLGGLHVIGTERHESRRIDNQLRGRAGRQGDPGSSQFFVSTDDDLMRIFGGDRMKKLMTTLRVPEDMPIENKLISRSIESAQTKVEGNNFDTRKHLVEYDDVINKHREAIYKKRNIILKKTATDISEENKNEINESEQMIFEMINNEIEQVVSFHTVADRIKDWNLNEIYEVVKTIFPETEKLKTGLLEYAKDNHKFEKAKARTKIIDYLFKEAKNVYFNMKENAVKKGVDWQKLENSILIRSIDLLWVEHLEAMASVRQGIGLRGYGQRDPLVEYKKEAFRLYNELNNLIQKEVVYGIFKIGAIEQASEAQFRAPSMADRATNFSAPQKVMSSGSSTFAGLVNQAKSGGASNGNGESREPDSIRRKIKDEEGNKIGRNDPCPCGSGKKYKKCCGR